MLKLTNLYRSFLGVCNLVFTASMILLAVRFWTDAGTGIRILISAGILLFPVFQPLMIYLRCRRIVGRMPGEMEILFEDSGITTASGEERSHVAYAELRSVVKIFHLLIIYTRSRQGFILNDRVLEGKGRELFQFLNRKVKRAG